MDEINFATTYILVKRVGKMTIVVEGEETPLPAFGFVELQVWRRDKQVAVLADLSIGLCESTNISGYRKVPKIKTPIK